jgi:opacity protein-like surface antigen
MKTPLAVLLAFSMAAPLAAQSRLTLPPDDDAPSIALRPFFVATGENMAAKETFKAVFGQSFEPFFGGGLELVLRKGLYVDVTASRFKKTGQRAFRSNGQSFGLGIPLTATITPFEVSAGYRFRISQRVFPYAGAGVGSYGYTETSDLSDPGENVNARHAGFLAVAGVDVRVHRWVGVAGDVQFTHVSGILGTGGISKDVNENDLGGVAVRLKVTVGR